MTFVFNSNINDSIAKHWQFIVALLTIAITFAIVEQANAGLSDEVNLGIQLAASPKLPKAIEVGKLYSVRFNAGNKGTATANNATVTVTLPSGIAASGLPTGCSAISSEVIKCVDASVAKNEKFTVSFKLKASDAAIGSGSVVANISSDDTDTQPANNTVTAAIAIGSTVDVSVVSRSGDENAKIVGSGELDCGATCQVTVKSNKVSGNKITLQAIPGFRKKLLKWTGTTCKATPPYKCTIKTKSGNKYQIGAVFGEATDEKVVLLLHGMNSDTSTWKDFVKKNFKTCNSIDNGTIIGDIKKNAAVKCYGVRFGAYDAKGENGLEDAKQWATDKNIRKAGDFSTFDQLGKEVDKAVAAIKSYHPGAHVLLIGHSRGGLAARAFLSNQTIDEPLNSLWTNYVDGLITTGSPHNGSPIGKIYPWLKNHPRDNCGFFDDCYTDWLAVDQLTVLLETAGLGLDARRPVIGYLATASEQILKLNAGKVSANVVTGQIRYGGLPLGMLSDSYNIFPSERNGGHTSLISIKLTDPAIDFMIGKDVKADTTNLLGDGIVPLNNQSYADAYVDKTYRANKVLHTDEPKRVTDINDMICKLTSPLIPSVKFDNWVKCP